MGFMCCVAQSVHVRRVHSYERLAYVACFAITSYAGTDMRLFKPFNPLLGETFETVRPELGFKCASRTSACPRVDCPKHGIVSLALPLHRCAGALGIILWVTPVHRFMAEKVIHHPTTIAWEAKSMGNGQQDGDDFVFWGNLDDRNDFRGNELRCKPRGHLNVMLPKHGEHYQWKRITTSIHNIILGTLYIDHHGVHD